MLTTLSVFMSLMLVFEASSSATAWPKQKVELLAADPCVRLLNMTAIVGCSTPSRGALAPLRVLRTEAELTALLAEPPDGRVGLALSAALFSARSLATLDAGLGSALAAVLVLHTDSHPAGTPSPSPATEDGGHAWNAAGSTLSTEHFSFAIVLLDASESRQVLDVVGDAAATAALARPLVQLRYPVRAVRARFPLHPLPTPPHPAPSSPVAGPVPPRCRAPSLPSEH